MYEAGCQHTSSFYTISTSLIEIGCGWLRLHKVGWADWGFVGLVDLDWDLFGLFEVNFIEWGWVVVVYGWIGIFGSWEYMKGLLGSVDFGGIVRVCKNGLGPILKTIVHMFFLLRNNKVICFHDTCEYRYIEWKLTVHSYFHTVYIILKQVFED